MVSKIKSMTIIYKNWKGEVGQRRIEPIRMWFGKTEYHPEPQWLLKAFDLDKRAMRDFAMNDVIHWGEQDG
jgi:predicted DNA-binding transcriptional regulator YafY